MDCFAVAIARRAQPGIDKIRLALVFAFVFGLFQTGMTVIGWAGGSLFMGIIAPWDHWVAFIILSVIGMKMITEGFRVETADIVEPVTFPRITTILLLAVAMSLDALAIGLSFALLNIDIIIPGIIIGLNVGEEKFKSTSSGEQPDRLNYPGIVDDLHYCRRVIPAVSVTGIAAGITDIFPFLSRQEKPYYSGLVWIKHSKSGC